MKYIKPIYEFRGVLSYLDELAYEVIDKIQDNVDKPVKVKLRGRPVNIKSACQLKTNMRGKTVTINLQWGDKLIDGYAAYVQFKDDLEFNLYTSTLQIPTIVHELKHIDRMVAKPTTRDYYYINQVGRHVVKNFPKELFFDGDNSKNILSKSFYFFDPNEFESYYNDMYRTLKSKLSASGNIKSKEIVKKFLKTHTAYIYYKFYYERGFDVDDFFKNTSYTNYFLNLLLEKIIIFRDGEDEDIRYRDFSQLKDLDIQPDDATLTSFGKEINQLMNKQIIKGFKKFHRLYTIFD